MDRAAVGPAVDLQYGKREGIDGLEVEGGGIDFGYRIERFALRPIQKLNAMAQGRRREQN